MTKNKPSKMHKNENDFFNWVKDNPNDEWPNNWEIAEWLTEFPKVDSLASLSKIMLEDGFFELKHSVHLLETWEYYWTHIAKDPKLDP